MSVKNPVTPPGIDPGTVRLVAQRLNHYATPGPVLILLQLKILSEIVCPASFWTLKFAPAYELILLHVKAHMVLIQYK